MSVSTDHQLAQAEDDIRYAEERLFRASQDRDATEAAFMRAVEAKVLVQTDLVAARNRLTEFRGPLCPHCGCFKADHSEPIEDDDRTGDWLCYDCGRELSCPR